MPDLSFRFAQATILVVDDAALSLRLITSALAKKGFNKLITANDGLEALEKTYALQPDLVLLDLHMPKLDGFGYCEKVRNDPTLSRMPIIVQTALEDRETKLRSLSDAGADDFLNKPLDVDELYLRVRLHLERSFMLQDVTQMCQYLSMELEETRGLVGQLAEPAPTLHKWQRHCEVLAEIAVFPSLPKTA